MIGWCPSLRATVADSPRTNRAFACRATCFKAVRRQVVALIDDQVTIASHTIINDALLDQALNHRDVQELCRRIATATDASDRLGRDAKECRQALHPLIEQLAPMDEHDRTDAALRDQPRADNRLAKRRGRRQHAGVVGEECVRRDLLVTPQFSLKGQIERAAGLAFVAKGWANPKVFERAFRFVETASWKTNVLGVVLGAGDHTRLVLRRQPHRRRLVELGVLKRRQPEQAIPKSWVEPRLGDIDLVPQHQLQR